MPSIDSHQRILYPVSGISEGTRIRKDYGDLDVLAASIKEHGLLQPIVINVSGVLIAGGRRFRAMRDVLKWTEVPVTYFEFADEVTLRILEREENVRRKPMTWQEEVLSVAEVHEHHKINASLKGEKWLHQTTGELLNMSRADVTYCLQLADYIRRGDKEIMACLRMWDAIHLTVKRRSEESTKLVAKITIPRQDTAAAQRVLESTDTTNTDVDLLFAPVGPNAGGVAGIADDGELPGAMPERMTIPLSKMLLKGDCIALLEQIEPESIDHVITDWPYGIDMDMLDQSNPHGGMKDIDSVRAEHDVIENESLHRVIVPLIYRVLKPGGWFITWTDYMQWQRNYDLAIKSGFKVQRWPFIWHKTSRCMNQAALVNFTKNHEPAIVCRKGNANLLTPQQSSIWMGGNEAEERALGHPFAKPFALWNALYSAVAHRGQVVLDPFAGRGSSTIAALQYGLQPIAIEVNEAHHNGLVVNVAEYYKRTLRNVEFV